jgi:replication-associated recombination protein RarA
MPLQELAENCRAFQQTLASIEEQRHVIRDLLDGERRRILEKLEQRIALQRKNAMTKLVEIVDRKLRENEDLVELRRDF